MQLIGSAILTISLTVLLGCASNPPPRISAERPKIDSWTIKVTTSGGLSGVGEGGWIADSQGDVAAGRELESYEPHYSYRLSCKGKLSEMDLLTDVTQRKIRVLT